MDQERRSFLQMFTPAAVQAAGVPTAKTENGRTPHYVMVVDLRRCVGCQACTVACSVENGVPAYQHRTIVSDYEVDSGGRSRRAVLPRLCNHCDNPPCVTGCPTKATYKREDGIVVVDSTICIGCGYCIQNCPYDARFINSETGTADKCTFCVQRVSVGLLPACVETCVGKARVFGDMNDPDSEVFRLLASLPAQVLKAEKGTEPNVYYIALDRGLDTPMKGNLSPAAVSHSIHGEG